MPYRLLLLVLSAGALSLACHPPPKPPVAYVRATPVADPPPPLPKIVEVPATPPSNRLQLRPTPKPAPAKPNQTPLQTLAAANQLATKAPAQEDYFNAIAQFAYEPGTLYQIYTAPMFLTDIALEPGERLVAQPAAGDTVRWVLATAKSVEDGQDRWHVYIKPTRAELKTNLAINTNRRSYLLELQSFADTYMASVKWLYPQDQLAAIALQNAETAAEQRSSAPVLSLEALNFNYAIQVAQGTPSWTPVQVFDDGRKTFIRFPQAMLVREAPALFVTREGEIQVVNYRQRGDFYIVDRLFAQAELRVGQQKQEIVRVLRTAPATVSKPPLSQQRRRYYH